MAFDPLSLLILKFRGRSVAVFRNHCPDYNVRCYHHQPPVPFPEGHLLILLLPTESRRCRTAQLAILAIYSC